MGGGSSGGYTQAQTGGFSGVTGIGGFGGGAGTGIGGFGGGGFSGGANYPVSRDATSFGGGGGGQIRKFVSVHVGPEEVGTIPFKFTLNNDGNPKVQRISF